MVAKSDLQFAGEYIVDECSIITTSGKTLTSNRLLKK